VTEIRLTDSGVTFKCMKEEENDYDNYFYPLKDIVSVAYDVMG
jgi:hypothetical protein